MEILCNVNVETHLDYKVEGVSCATFGDHVFLIPHWGSDGGAGEVSDAGIDGDEMPPDGSTDAASETRR
jgi:hypothetical protein